MYINIHANNDYYYLTGKQTWEQRRKQTGIRDKFLQAERKRNRQVAGELQEREIQITKDLLKGGGGEINMQRSRK